jgi:hypothetical protein
MGQYKVYINFSTQLMIGFCYDKGFSFEVNILCFIIGFGLTSSAKGFGFWKR